MVPVAFTKSNIMLIDLKISEGFGVIEKLMDDNVSDIVNRAFSMKK